MPLKLTNKLIFILALGLLLAFVSQITTRLFFELPALYDLENRSDEKDIQRIRNSILHQSEIIAGIAIDYAAWDETYEAMLSLAGSDRGLYDRFIATIMIATNYPNLDIHGGVIVDKSGEVRFSNHVDEIVRTVADSEKLQPGSIPSLDLLQANTAPVEPLISLGISQSNLGPVLYAASHILKSEPPYRKPEGMLVFWRLLDDEFFDDLKENLQVKLDFIPIKSARTDPRLNGLVNKLLGSPTGYLPRDENGHLYWFLTGTDGRELFLVRQETDKRVFASDLLSTSVLVGFAASAFILLFILLFFSRTVIRRILNAKDIMVNIVNTGDYDKRLEIIGTDEIDTMFTQFNQLLTYIQEQSQKLLNQNQELADLTQQDALTGVFNRRYLDDALLRCARQCARSGQSLSVLMIDIDCFKGFNDTYGHQAGDDVLRQVAQALQNNLHRATDHLARYGGEEFCVILTDTPSEDAVIVAERLRESVLDLRIPSEVSVCAALVTISIGVATARLDEATGASLDLMKIADQALYESKEQGRNRVTATVHTANPFAVIE